MVSYHHVGSAVGSQLGSRTKSQESLTSAQPASQSKSPIEASPEQDGQAQSELAGAEIAREPTPIPQTRCVWVP